MSTSSVQSNRRATARRHAPWGAAFGAVAALAASAAAHAVVSCSVSATGPAFGNYNPLTPSPATANGSVVVTCTLSRAGPTTVTAVISLSTGSSASFAARTLLAGASTLSYNLYQSATFAQVWGDGTGGSFTETAILTLHPPNWTQQATSVIYGVIPAGQDVAAGSYSDTIAVTVNY